MSDYIELLKDQQVFKDGLTECFINNTMDPKETLKTASNFKRETFNIWQQDKTQMNKDVYLYNKLLYKLVSKLINNNGGKLDFDYI